MVCFYRGPESMLSAEERKHIVKGKYALVLQERSFFLPSRANKLVYVAVILRRIEFLSYMCL
jgi:hypothetical protein